MRQQHYPKSPQRQQVQGSKRRSPSIGLPSSYPASPTMIAIEQKASAEYSTTTRDESLMMPAMSLDHNDSMSSFDTSVLLLREGSMEARQEPQPTPRQNSTTPSKSHRRRQRNRAFSDEDFAAIMNDYTSNSF